MTPQNTLTTVSRKLLWALAALVLVRLISLGFYPLMDTTEARYGDIARRMVERADWITPWFTDTEPFWGKPPLSFWASALGFKLFGINEFAARLPHLLMGALVAVFSWMHAAQRSSRAGWHTVAILSSSLLFTVASGAVMTDMALTLGTTLVMVGFWAAMQKQPPRQSLWHAVVVVGLSIGLLAKGPLALVLCGFPIAAWLLWQRRVLESFQRLDWGRIGVWTLLLSLPWYALAERKTPGFLNYFLVGEHWHRFMTPLWTGDRYGAAHALPRGGVWLLLLGACLPWPFLLAPWIWIRGRVRSPAAATPGSLSTATGIAKPQWSYLLLWGLWPCVFFTFSGNVIWTYVLPGLPALAVLAALWTASQSGKGTEWLLTGVLWFWTLTLVVCVVLANGEDYRDRRSVKVLMNDYKSAVQRGEPLYFLFEVPFSGSFYSDGQAKGPIDVAQLTAFPASQSTLVVMPEQQLTALPAALKSRVTIISSRGGRLLLRLKPV